MVQFWVVNGLSLARLISAPVLMWLILRPQPFWTLSFWLVLAAAFSDYADGALARFWGVTSPLGAALDPVADKMFAMAVASALTLSGRFPFVLLCAMLLRDVVIVAGYGALRFWGIAVAIQPAWSGKLYTALQMSLLVFLMSEAAFFPHGLNSSLSLLKTLLWTAVWAMLIVSFYHYVRQGAMLWINA